MIFLILIIVVLIIYSLMLKALYKIGDRKVLKFIKDDLESKNLALEKVIIIPSSEAKNLSKKIELDFAFFWFGLVNGEKTYFRKVFYRKKNGELSKAKIRIDTVLFIFIRKSKWYPNLE